MDEVKDEVRDEVEVNDVEVMDEVTEKVEENRPGPTTRSGNIKAFHVALLTD